jgi:hypothetical protein
MDPGEVNFFDKNVADVINLDLKRFLFFQTCHKNILQNRKADPGLAKRRNTFESQSSDLCTMYAISSEKKVDTGKILRTRSGPEASS